ncbi:hypothetical protein QR680_001889 [Steinernema hermaphroditum]|uniref:pantothenate kinase n=1 Tax=Steinernema hermaphroditum TaxID=289476 RepID=A0AA39H0A8_9BILA|nr:hypothetical protein QR680_001889 [Steinernema hermaphroditum]
MAGISNDDIQNFLSNLERRASSSVTPFSEFPMPWFGLDIGGTLTKLVYFEPTDDGNFETEEELLSDRMIQRYLTTNKAYGDSGVRDEHLELQNVTINNRIGTIHFIRFPTNQMPTFITLVKEKEFTLMSSTVCATGGGAIKYAKDAESELNMQLLKSDELESLIKGIELIASVNNEECYYYDYPLDNERCRKVSWKWSKGCCSSECTDHSQATDDGLQYPYIVVNIGSGVSVMAVYGQHDFKRISGSSIGGGFFQGLCCLLCGCDSFEEAVMLASHGNNRNIDKLVKDIYGRAYDNVGLPEDTVAASFGKICSNEARENATREDLAHSALVTTTNNIGSVALNAANHCKIDRIVFVGNFLRVNPIAARLLSKAMDFWSQGTKKALFLQHEGYFGAVGCLDKLVAVTEMRKKQREGLSSSSSASSD